MVRVGRVVVSAGGRRPRRGGLRHEAERWEPVWVVAAAAANMIVIKRV